MTCYAARSTTGDLLDRHAAWKRETTDMLDTIILDIDDTLLAYPQSSDAFAQQVTVQLVRFFGQWISPQKMAPALARGQQAMDANQGPEFTNAKLFFDAFCPIAGCGPQEAREMFERFYVEEFPKYEHLTHPMPGARAVVEWAFENGRQVAIATGFQSSVTAVELRLAWAGVPVTEFNYAFLTTVDNMHASKPYVGYYYEVLEHLGRQPGQCLMVGDHWTHDIVPAASVGMGGYWITSTESVPPEPLDRLVGHGRMLDLRALLEDQHCLS